MTNNYKKKILIVDDEVQVADIFKIYLESANYEVNCINSGREALDYLRKEQSDAVVLDLLMPGISGRDILREYKNLYNNKKRPYTIIVTGELIEKNTMNELKELGANDILSKPFHCKDLVDKVNNALK